MTDTSDPPTSIHVHDTVVPSLPKSINVAQPLQNGASPPDEAQDDDGQISCFCGFSDDDGNTVACDLCNRWQHTICYYPQYEGRDLPEELQHFCVDCRPRPLDTPAAQTRQRVKREQQDSLLSAKRQGTKSHKKKIKDAPPSSVHTNGWPLDRARHDRTSASPRDQPPPAKRPKTSHPASDSTNATKGHSRKRNASTAHNRSLSQSPDQPIDQYSPEFLRCYHEDDWNVTQANLHNDIAVTNALSEWLRAPDDEFRALHGTEKREVLLRWDGELDDIPGKAQIDIQEVRDTRRSDDSNSPSWKIVTVKEPVASGAYIGELKGHVGFMNQYKMDPANRWPILRHPEPFVFFHQSLQIYIDARSEGTELRYVRRSCRPNARLQVLVTDQTDYRFCFMATEQIDPGMEVAVAWDTADSGPRSATGISPRDMDILSAWVSSVLSNCGPCACHPGPGECAMSRFDRRRDFYEDSAPQSKPLKHKKKRAGPHVSPLDTHALNSRSGSEVRKADVEDDRSESRSASVSGRGSASRDITPNTHYSTNGGNSSVPEMSERERKKLAKEEEMFRRQAEEQSGKGKKKRSSAGSNLNTPSLSYSKHTGFPHANGRYVDSGTSRQSGLPSQKSNGKRNKGAVGKTTLKRPRVAPVVRPEYKDASTQVNFDQTDAKIQPVTTRPKLRVISTQQYLLRYLEQRSAMRCASRTTDATKSPEAKPGRTPLPERPSAHDNIVVGRADGDVTMADAPDHNEAAVNSESLAESPDAARSTYDGTPRVKQETSDIHGSSLAENASDQVSRITEDAELLAAHKAPDLHLSMPPPPSAASMTASSGLPTASTPGSLGAPIAQSPGSLVGSTATIFSPAIAAAVTPSPARKKLSLSDYTRRSKAKDTTQPDGKVAERDSSPASTASGPPVPTLQQSSSSSDAANIGEGEDSNRDEIRVREVTA